MKIRRKIKNNNKNNQNINSTQKKTNHEQILEEIDKISSQKVGNATYIKIDITKIKRLTSKAESAFSKGKYRKAEKLLKKLTGLDQKNSSFWMKLGETYQKLERPIDAINSYNTCISLDPKNYNAWFQIGNLLQEAKKKADALYCYNKAAKLNPENENIIYKQAIAQFESNNKIEALSSCMRLLSINPHFLSAKELKDNIIEGINEEAEKLQANKKYQEAIQIYNQILNKNPINANILSRKGDAYNKIQDIEKALECYNKALLISPGFYRAEIGKKELIPVIYEKAEKLKSEGDFKAAINTYDTILKIIPGDKDTWLSKGKCFEFIGKYQDTLYCLNKALEIEPYYSFNIDILLQKVNIQIGLEQQLEAHSTLDTILNNDPENVDALVIKGTLLQNNKEYDGALEHIEKACKIEPENEEINNKRKKIIKILEEIAEKSLQEKDYEVSYEKFLKIYNLEPTRSEISYKLGMVLIELKDYDKAIEYFEEIPEIHTLYKQSLKQKKKISNYLIDQVNNLIKEKEYDDALSIINKILEKDN
jgi:tetratricopeptide (TPR) repeat protein